MLLGETGVGKSSAGNIILGREEFHTDLSSSSVTTRCQKAIREFNGQTLAIIDTPGLFHTDKSNEEVVREIADCITWISPGPHVFLLVLRLGTFSRQDKKCLETFQKVFKDAKCYMIVLFTYGDQCEQGCDAFIKRHKDLKRFMEESCEAHHVFNNRAEDECQVNGLLQKINHTVQNNGGSCYSNELIREIEPVFKEVMQLPEVTSAGDPEQTAVDFIFKCISEYIPENMLKHIPENMSGKMSKAADAMGGEAQLALKVVTRYLNFLNKWLYEHMPDESKK